MKIEINIDIEAIVREVIHDYVKENIVITNVPGSTTLVSVKDDITINLSTEKRDVILHSTNSNADEEEKVSIPEVDTTKPSIDPIVDWEFAPEPKKRRSKAEIALHEKELALGRRLTPEEKGETKAAIELDEGVETKAKEAALQKARIDDLAKEGKEAAAKEISEEEKTTEPVTENKPLANSDLFTDSSSERDRIASEESEPGIPETDDLDELNNLFK